MRRMKRLIEDFVITYPPQAQSRGKFLGRDARLHVHDLSKPCLQARLTANVTPAESIA